MTNRVSTEILSNGAVRYGIYNADGTLNRYEYIKAEDEPTEVGTELNKANLLDDTTAELYGLDDTEGKEKTPNRAFAEAQNIFKSVPKIAKVGDIVHSARADFLALVASDGSKPFIEANGQLLSVTQVPELAEVMSSVSPTTFAQTSFTSGYADAICKAQNGKYYAVSYGGVFESEDMYTWNQVKTTAEISNMQAKDIISMSDGTIVMCGNNGIITTYDYFTSIIKSPHTIYGYCLLEDNDGNLLVGTNSSGIKYSTDKGMTFATAFSPSNGTFKRIVKYGSGYMAVCDETLIGTWYGTNSITWSWINQNSAYAFSDVVVIGDYLYAVGDTNGQLASICKGTVNDANNPTSISWLSLGNNNNYYMTHISASNDGTFYISSKGGYGSYIYYSGGYASVAEIGSNQMGKAFIDDEKYVFWGGEYNISNCGIFIGSPQIELPNYYTLLTGKHYIKVKEY